MKQYTASTDNLEDYVGNDPGENDNWRVVYLASDVDSLLATNEETNRKQKARIANLERALREIAAMGEVPLLSDGVRVGSYVGHEAQIASSALGKEVKP